MTMHPPFDTLEQTELLKQSGMDESPARAVVRAIRLAHDDQAGQVGTLVSKEHLQAEMAVLRSEMAELRSEMATKTEIADLQTQITELQIRMTELKADMIELRSELKTEMTELKTDVDNLRSEVGSLRSEMATKTEIAELKAELFRMMWLQGGTILLVMTALMGAFRIF